MRCPTACPGRSYVTRRAVVDVVRMAVLGQLRCDRHSRIRSLGRRLLRWSGLAQSGIRVSLDRTVAIEVDLTVGAGLPILEVARQVDFGRPLRSSAIARPRRRRARRSRQWASLRAEPRPDIVRLCPQPSSRPQGPRRQPRQATRNRPRSTRGPPMTRRSCDGSGLLAAFRAAVANLEAHVTEIDGLNVFPVPDGDTGSTCSRPCARRSRRRRRSSTRPPPGSRRRSASGR